MATKRRKTTKRKTAAKSKAPKLYKVTMTDKSGKKTTIESGLSRAQANRVCAEAKKTIGKGKLCIVVPH